jgi:hypothetical protein
VRRFFGRGRGLRAVAAWLFAALAAGALGATLTVGYLLAREAALHPPFPPQEWWTFVNLWRPMLIAAAILAPLFSALPALAIVIAIRRLGLPRPAADIAGGALCGFSALVVAALTARLVINFGSA